MRCAPGSRRPSPGTTPPCSASPWLPRPGGDDWSWLKWLPHNDIPGAVDGAGPARYLAASVAQLR